MRCAKFLFVTILGLQLLTVSANAGEQRMAPILPLAQKSLLLDIAYAGERLVACGERGHILYSDDDGSHWQQALVPTTQMLTGIHFANSQLGWAVGHDGLILVSDNGGESWRMQRDGIAVQQQANLELREEASAHIAQLKAAVAAAGDDVPQSLTLQLDDARMDLEDADLALQEAVFTSPLMDVWFQDNSRGWAVGAFGTFVGTTDGGRHWRAQHELLYNPDEYHLNTVTGDGAGRIFVAGEGGVMFRSTNGGKAWEALPSFYEGSWFGAVYNQQHDVLLVFGLRGHLYRSDDFGTTWVPVESDNANTLAGGSSTSASDIVIAGGVGTVLHSTDGGKSFNRTLLQDRLSLSSGVFSEGQLIVVGQGGAKILQVNAQ